MLVRTVVMIAAVCYAGQAAVAQKGDSKRITADDIAAQTDIKTAHEAIRRIRPNFFRLPPNTQLPAAESNNSTTRPERSLFVDGVHQDRLDDLKAIPASDVYEIRLYSEADVVLYLGKQGHVFGAIAVTTKAKKPGP